jgi:hypothetical protein
MSGRPARRLRVAAAGDPGQPAPPEPLRLVSALSPAGRLARAEGFLDPALAHEVRLPGIGGRYLATLAADAHGRGWAPLEVSALLDAVEDRSTMWVVCPSAAALRRAGFVGRRLGLPTRTCARWSAGRWSRAGADPGSLRAVAGVARPGVVCVSAVSGRGAPARLAAAVAGPGIRSGRVEAGLAAALGVPWAIELLLAPALPPGSLMAARERLAAAPRCGWCGVPIPTGRCRRCQPGVPG